MKFNFFIRCICLIFLFTTFTVQADSRVPFSNAEHTKNLEVEEQRLWYESQSFQKAIRKGGQLYQSDALEVYVQSVMDRLYPEFKGIIKVHVVKSPILNAFAIPDGHIYMHTGLLSRFDNEAQLATVLAHEGAHFIYRHGYYNQQSLKNTTGFATLTAVIGIPVVGLIGNVLAVSSIYGYSRDLETEADNIGFQRLKDAGYDLNEAYKVFEHLAAEVKLSEVKESVFYSTHPKLQDRIENFTTLAKQHEVSGDKHAEIYAKKVAELRLEELESELSYGRYKHVIALLSNEQAFSRYPPQVHYYLAEAYRKRNDEGDALKAMEQADKAIQLLPDFAPSYRTKGMLLMSKNQNKEAQLVFEKYLVLLPQAKDKTYIEAYLQKINTQ
jgi:beta-barrel assembly-enhancing protease